METNRVKLKVYDNQFAHGTTLGSGDLKILPDEFVWTRGDDATNKGICVVTESFFNQVQSIRVTHKIGLLIEPISIDRTYYAMVRNPEFQKHFDFILTHNQSLIELNPEKFKFYPFMGCWIHPDDKQVYTKTKDLSIIASDKQMTAGHKLRHEVIRRFRPMFKGAVFGRGSNPIDYKLEALKDYRFQVVIENEKNRHWFTEKICDCFVTGTIPIYHGTPSIGEFYNADGIIQFNTADELEDILKNCNETEYNRRLDAVKDNFERAKKYKSLPDNYIYDWIKQQYKL